MSDQIGKRLNIASEGEAAVTKFVDALNTLINLSAERAYAGNFLDSDFVNTGDLKHLDAGMIGTLFDFVVPSLLANFNDVANSGRNKQILLQVRK